MPPHSGKTEPKRIKDLRPEGKPLRRSSRQKKSPRVGWHRGEGWAFDGDRIAGASYRQREGGATSDLSFHIREFVPDFQGEELEQRQALLTARDYAANLRGKAWTRTALEHAAAAHEMAGAFVFADVPVDRLKIAVAYCRNMVHAAFLADHLGTEVEL